MKEVENEVLLKSNENQGTSHNKNLNNEIASHPDTKKDINIESFHARVDNDDDGS